MIAKIEKSEAIDALDELVEEADALMVARGDLGVEMGAAMVPLLQKEIIRRALEAGKPVITATQMLESMVEHAEPTRAEASDVANAILDGTSAVMMSAETAIGAYPVEAVRTMDSIARAVEPSMRYRHQTPEAAAGGDVRRAMSNAVTDLAETLDAKAILVATASRCDGVRRWRGWRPRRPMVEVSHHQAVVQQMALEWGVLPLLMPSTADVEDLWTRTIETARGAGIIDSGDLVVLIAGTADQPDRFDERDQGRRRLSGRCRAAGAPGAPGRKIASCAPPPHGCSPSEVSSRSASSTGIPLRSYQHTDALLRTRESQVSALRAQTQELQARIATVGSSEGLVREARRLGFVKPGEQLFIVRGIAGWRATH